MLGMPKLRSAVFLDRDGTLNEECDYLFRIEDCRFIPGVAEAVKKLNHAGFMVVVVTNQSGVARGFYAEADIVKLHLWMSAELAAAGARIDAWYYCPHHPDCGEVNDCTCRKPSPGMLFQASEEHAIDLASSWMVGDKIADVAAGLAAGCRPLLVRTGYGAREESLAPVGVVAVDSLLSAAKYIISETDV